MLLYVALGAALYADKSFVLSEVADALDPVCEYISADDPHERYQSYGYRVAGYLRGMITDTERCYAYVSLDSQGTVESVSYDAYIDMTISPEENLSRIEKDFEVLNRALKRADVPTEFPDLLSHYRLSEEFKTAFMRTTAAAIKSHSFISTIGVVSILSYECIEKAPHRGGKMNK